MAGRIENRVRTTDGTAAVYGLELLLAKASHWRDPRRRKAACIPQGWGRESEDLLQFFPVLCEASEGGPMRMRSWYNNAYTMAFFGALQMGF